MPLDLYIFKPDFELNQGKIIADLINLMVDNNFVKVDDIVIVGYSLGAHAAGFAGKNIKNGKINRCRRKRFKH